MVLLRKKYFLPPVQFLLVKHPEKASESILHIPSIEVKDKIFPLRLKAARYFVRRLSHRASEMHTDQQLHSSWSRSSFWLLFRVLNLPGVSTTQIKKKKDLV